MLEVEAVGTAVRFGDPSDPITGRIDGVCIRHGDAVSYDVVWWNGRVRNNAWMHRWEFEVDPSASGPRKIGFRQ